jgi:RNA polymerase sigma-70 factor (ECF subfamily)
MLIDGGGVVPADPRPFRGPTDVAHKICDVLENDPAVITEREVNGQRGLVLLRRGRVTAVVGISVRKRKVTGLWVVLNPNKLRRWNIAPAHPATG